MNISGTRGGEPACMAAIRACGTIRDATNLINAHLPTPAAAPFIACGQPVFGVVSPPINVNHGENNSCSPNFSFYQVGSRTQWNVTKDFYMGVDVTYTHSEHRVSGRGHRDFPYRHPNIKTDRGRSKHLVRALPGADEFRSPQRGDKLCVRAALSG